MTGLLSLVRGRGRLTPAEVEIGGVRLLSAALFVPPGCSGRRLERRLAALERTLLERGAGRVVTMPDFPYASRLTGLHPVEPVRLYQAAADVLILGWLARRGLQPERCAVVLEGPRLCWELTDCARRLCPRVRALGVDVPGAGTDFARSLQARYGLPVLPAGAQADLRVAFGPCPGGAALRLYDPPVLDGLRLTAPELSLPAALELQLLTLLWEEGRVRRGQLCAA